MSSNTMSGEEPGTLEGFDEQVAEETQQASRRNPVGSVFAGPAAKRQKLEAQAQANASAKVMQPTDADAGDIAPPAQVFAAPRGFAQPNQPIKPVQEEPPAIQEPVTAIKLPEPEIQVRTGKASKKKTDVAIQKNKPKKSRKLSRPEIQVRTGALAPKLSQPEIQVRTGRLSKKLSLPEIQISTGLLNPEPEAQLQPTGLKIEQEVAIELIQVADVLEAMQTLEADVQESHGQYEPVQEDEIQLAKSLGFQRLFFRAPDRSELQYELDLEPISQDEFQQTHAAQLESQIESHRDGETSQEEVPAEPLAAEETIDDRVDDAMLCAEGADLYEEPLTAAASAAELGLVFEPQSYRKDTKKTQFLTIPKQGIKRSNRGTIEAVFQPNGKVVEAQYNRCGILVEVSVAGAMKLTRAADTGKWTMSRSDGSQPVNSINNVNFDRHGNLSYSTDDGVTTMICADGSVIQRA